MTHYYIQVEQDTKGPYSIHQLKQMWSSGHWNLASLFFTVDSNCGEGKSEGANEWKKMEEIANRLEGNEDISPSAIRINPPTHFHIDQKKRYNKRLRTESSYPTFRRLATVLSYIFYAMGALAIITGFIGLINTQPLGLLVIIPGILVIAIGKAQEEAFLLLADIADSMNDINCRFDY
jgi:hypothetical protein